MYRFLAILLITETAAAQTPSSAEAQLQEMSKLLKPMLLQALPTPLYEKGHNWNHTSMVPHAVHWKGLKPTIVKTPRNDGVWRKVRIEGRNLPGTLDLKLFGLRNLDKDRQAFHGILNLDVKFELEEQIWESGLRLYAGSVRGRVRLQLDLEFETTLRLEQKDAILPDLIFRLRVDQAKLTYRDMVIEHLAGVGGSAAKVMGEAAHSALNQWRPSIERNLLERANAAIVKAADTKEVRIGLGGIQKVKP